MKTSRLGLFLRPEFVFLAFAIVFGSLLLFITPPLSGLDEQTHVARVDQLAHLNLKSDFVGYASWYNPDEEGSAENTAIYGGEIDSDLWDFVWDNLDRSHSTDQYYHLPLSQSSGDRALGSQGTSAVAAFSNTAVNSPIVYAPQVVGYALAGLFTSSVFWMYFVARLAGFAFFVGASFWCIRQMPVAKWACVAILLSPAVFLGAIPITADTVTFSCICLFVATVLRVAAAEDDVDPSPSDWAQLAVFSLLLSGIKATYIPVLGLMAVLPIVRPSFRTRRRFLALVAIVVATLVVFAAWYLYAIRSINTGAMWDRFDANPPRQVAYILSHPAQFLGMTADSLVRYDIMQVEGASFATMYRGGALGAGFPVPAWLVTLSYVLAVVVAERSERVSDAFARWLPAVVGVLLAISLLSIVLVCAALYISFSSVGESFIDGLQSRYFSPVALYVICAISALVFRARLAVCGRGTGSAGAGVARAAHAAHVARAAPARGDSDYAGLSRWKIANVGLKALMVVSLLAIQVLTVALDYSAYIR